MVENSIPVNETQRLPPQPSAGTKGVVKASGEKPAVPDYDQPFLKQLWKIIRDNLRNVPNFIKNNFKWLIPLLIVWFGISVIPDLTMATLPGFLKGIIGIVIFLTATYNPWFAKALYAAFIIREVIPFIREIKAKGFKQAFKDRVSRITRTFAIAYKAFKSKGKQGYILLLWFGGAGLMFANLLSRNSHFDKYLIVFLTAVAIFWALSRGLNDPVIRLVRAFWRDVSGAAKKEESSITTANLYVAIASFAVGMVVSILFVIKTITNNFIDPTGYIIGGACIVVGLIWYFAGRKTNKQTLQPEK